jgi:hypothetical protein
MCTSPGLDWTSRAMRELARTRGDLIAFTDDDVELHSHWASEIVAAFARSGAHAATGRSFPPAFRPFIGTITPSGQMATVTASGALFPPRVTPPQTARARLPALTQLLDSRSRLDFEGLMFPNSRNKSSPSYGVRCATTKAACRAASSVQRPSTIPARSSSGHSVRSPSPPR